MTETLSKDQILAALKGVRDPDRDADIVSLGLVSEVVIHKGKVYFAISVDPARAAELEDLRRAAENVVKDIPGVEGVAVTLTADREPGSGGQRQWRGRPARAASPCSARSCSPRSCTSGPWRHRAGRGPRCPP